MRKRMFYVIVLILSIIANVEYTLANDYCSDPNQKDNDYCADSPIDMEDNTWTAKKHFNNRKAVCTSAKSIEVDLHRGLYIKDSNANIKLYPVKEENCKKVLTVQNGAYGIEEFKGKHTFQIPVNNDLLVSVFEPECRLIAEISDRVKKERIDHVFMRNIKAEEFGENDIFPAADKVKLGYYIFSEQKLTKDMKEENVPFQTKEVNKFFKYPAHIVKSTICNSKCKHGRVFKYIRNEGIPFANKFNVKGTCEWMTIHINNGTNVGTIPDYKVYAAEVSFRHSFVTLPKEVKAFPMDFENYEINFDKLEHKGYEVTIGYSGHNGENIMVIANSHGHAVRTKTLMPSTEEISFAFSHEDCLEKPIGAEINTAGQFQDFPFHEDLNIAFRVETVDRYTGSSYWEDQYIKLEGNNYLPPSGFKKKDYDETKKFGGSSKDDVNIGVKREELKPIVNVPPVHEEAPITHVMSDQDQESINKKKEVQKDREEAISKAMKDTKAYYLYWGIPAGFGVGSFGSFIICNIIMFIFKRSVLTFWYKAMYKRYGSDTTMGAGTTMGKTVGGETIGGATTVGGTTAGGETTGSTTAA